MKSESDYVPLRNTLEKKLFLQIDDMVTKEFSEEVRVEAVAMQESLSESYKK